MTGSLRTAVIGCGAIAYEHLPFVATSALAELVAVCDRSRALATAAGERFRAGSLHIDVAEMRAAERPDIVHVLTPPHTHDPIVRASLAAGAHVVCEKPMTGTAAETGALLDAAAAAGRALVESRNLLWNDPVLALGRAVDEGRLGTVVECDILLSLDFLAGPFGDPNLSGPGVVLPGGAVHDFMPHLVYLFQALTGETDPREVRGFLRNRSGNLRAGYDWLDALIEGDVRGRLRVATDVYPEQFRVILRGTKATVETDLYNPYWRFDAAPNVGKRAPLGQFANGRALIGGSWANFRNKVMQHGTMHGLPRMLDATYGALLADQAPPIAPADMLATARLCDRLVALGEPA